MMNIAYGFSPNHYGVVLLSSEMDQLGQYQMVAAELTAAVEVQGGQIKLIDPIKEVRRLTDAYHDPHCLYFVCFNGHGSELSVVTGNPRLTSAFEYYNKPLIDLMSECPIHITMAHQLQSVGTYRNLFLTDYSYAVVGRLLGFKNVQFSTSFTLPLAAGQISKKAFSQRSIDVLLPIGPTDFETVRNRYAYPLSHKDRVYKEIFESVVSRAAADLRIDPLIETLVALQEIHCTANLSNPEVGYLISATIDFVTRKRQHDLLSAVKHLPLTVVTDQDLEHEFPTAALRRHPDCSSREMLQMMADAKSVVCPILHHTGFNANVMSAFSAGSYVMAAPNEVLETHFAQGAEMSIYQDTQELVSQLESILNGDADLEPYASAGSRKAMERFSPAHIVNSIATVLSLRPSKPPVSAHACVGGLTS